MKINYLYEAGAFGSYKNKRSPEANRKVVAKELERVAKISLLDKISPKIGELIKEHIDKNSSMYINHTQSGLNLVGKNGNKKTMYGCWNAVNGGWKSGSENTMPVFRLVLENNTIVVIISCVPYDNYKIAIQEKEGWFDWIESLKSFLNSNIYRITEDGSPFNYDGFDVKLEIDPDILDNNGRVNVALVPIIYTYNINEIQDFVDHFYNQDIRIKTQQLTFYKSMSSNEMYQQYIERFPDLIKCTEAISLDMSAMKEFDLENLNIISVLADPHSDVEVNYNLRIKETEVSLEAIDNFVHNEYNMSFEKFKKIAYLKRSKSIYVNGPDDLQIIYVSYKYNNPKSLKIKGVL